MKVLCPRCGQPVLLDHLEKSGGQSGICTKCKIFVRATYEKALYKETWEVHFEKQIGRVVSKESSNKGGGCLGVLGIYGGLILILAILYILFVAGN